MKQHSFISLFVGLSFFLISTSLSAQTVDTIEVYSTKMDRIIKNTVVLPAGYDADDDTRYSVIYLLHGHGGTYKTCTDFTKKSLPEDAAKWNVIFVAVDGQNSWYWDSPIDPEYQFETYISKELVQHIDSSYNTIASPKARAITGYSMGGHGALWMGINHPDVFGACGSMSGGVDIRPFPDSWNMKDRLGEYATNKEVWDNHTVTTQLDKIKADSLKIIIDCGVDDFFYRVNEELHRKMVEKKIAHDYITRPGGHSHDYWRNSIDYHFLFFSIFFQSNK